MKIPGTLTKISDTQFTFTPTEDLSNFTKYKFVIKKSFKDIEGTKLYIDFESEFTTINRNVKFTYPIDELNAGTTINITWISQNLDADTIDIDYFNGTSWSNIGNSINISTGTLEWTVPLMLGTRQLRIISSSGYSDYVTFDIIADPLILTDIDPLNGATEVERDSVIELTFNNDMDVSNDSEDIYILMPDGLLEGQFNISIENIPTSNELATEGQFNISIENIPTSNELTTEGEFDISIENIPTSNELTTEGQFNISISEIIQPNSNNIEGEFNISIEEL